MKNMPSSVIAVCRKNPLVSIFILAVIVRVILLLIFPLPDQTGGDFPLYQRIADNILADGNLGGEPQKTYGSPSISPGFAFFLAGYEFFFGKSVAALVLASVVLGSLLAAGTYALAAFFLERRAALLAGAAAALWPVFLIQTFMYGTSLLLYSVLLIFGAYFLVRAVRGSHLAPAVASGALLGFASLVDAIGFFIPFVFVLWMFFERRSWRTVLAALLFLVAAGLVIAPWTYRNIAISHITEQAEVPVIAKDELKYVTPGQLSLMAKLVSEDEVLVSGLSKMYLFPYGISVLDQGTAISYRTELRRLLREGEAGIATEKLPVLLAKAAITLLHWTLLVFVVAAIVALWRNHSWSLPILVLLLIGYVTAAVIGYGSIAQNDFQSISALNSFLFPIIPFFIILAIAMLDRHALRLREHYRHA